MNHRDEQPEAPRQYNGSWDDFFDAAEGLDKKLHILICPSVDSKSCFRSIVVRDLAQVEYLRSKCNELLDMMRDGIIEQGGS